MKKHIYTDLAIESREIYQEENNKGEIEGVSVDVVEEKNHSVTTVKVLNDRGSSIIGKPIGTYITIEVPNLNKTDEDLKDEVSIELSKVLKNLVKDLKKEKVLIVGLGNWNISSDALGPKVIERVLVTRHIFINYNKESDESMVNVAAMSPGVLGLTGIETFDVVKGIVDKIKPDLVIAIDALSSRKMERVSTTIQITDIGITPGSGVGNHRQGLNKESLGVPVVSLGIPTVVNAATMVNDTMDLILDSLKNVAEVGKEFYSLLDELSDNDKYALIEEVLNPFMGNVIVTPKDINVLIDDLSIVIANGLNIALHPGIDISDVNRYIR
ncbi:MAG: GPR endopeptidase [Tissierellaceae bacterium]|nr:GPR endopeptidase [Tissierellaceae bacterium]